MMNSSEPQPWARAPNESVAACSASESCIFVIAVRLLQLMPFCDNRIQMYLSGGSMSPRSVIPAWPLINREKTFHDDRTVNKPLKNNGKAAPITKNNVTISI